MRSFMSHMGGGPRGQPQLGWWPQCSCHIHPDRRRFAQKEKFKKSPAVVGLCCGEVRPGCSPSIPLCPLNEETRAQPGLRQGKGLVLVGSHTGQGVGGTSRKRCSWEHSFSWGLASVGSCNLRSPSAAGLAHPVGAGARLSLALHGGASLALLLHTQISWDTTEVAL